jgi:hypothetical protein
LNPHETGRRQEANLKVATRWGAEQRGETRVALLEPYPRKLPEPDLTRRLPKGADAKRRFMALWLADGMEPGDRLVTGAEGIVGRPRAFEIAKAIAAIAGLSGIYPGWFGWASHTSRLACFAAFVLFEGTVALSLADTFTLRRVYVAVTERRVVVVALDRHRHPVKVAASLPIDATWLDTGRRSLTFRAADGSPLLVRGKARPRLRLTISNWRGQLDDTAAAVAARGGMVNVPLVLGSGVLSGPA